MSLTIRYALKGKSTYREVGMNSTPRPPTVTNTRGHAPEFEQIIREKSENFVGREFVFTTINEFLPNV